MCRRNGDPAGAVVPAGPPAASQAAVTPPSSRSGICSRTARLSVRQTLTNRIAELTRVAQAKGAKYLVLPYLMAAERGGGAPFYLQLADRLNTVGEQVKKAGLQL